MEAEAIRFIAGAVVLVSLLAIKMKERKSK